MKKNLCQLLEGWSVELAGCREVRGLTLAGSHVRSCGPCEMRGRQMEWKSSPIKPGLSSEEEANSSERWPLAPWEKVLTQIFV